MKIAALKTPVEFEKAFSPDAVLHLRDQATVWPNFTQAFGQFFAQQVKENKPLPVINVLRALKQACEKAKMEIEGAGIEPGPDGHIGNFINKQLIELREKFPKVVTDEVFEDVHVNMTR